MDRKRTQIITKKRMYENQLYHKSLLKKKIVYYVAYLVSNEITNVKYKNERFSAFCSLLSFGFLSNI